MHIAAQIGLMVVVGQTLLAVVMSFLDGHFFGIWWTRVICVWLALAVLSVTVAAVVNPSWCCGERREVEKDDDSDLAADLAALKAAQDKMRAELNEMKEE